MAKLNQPKMHRIVSVGNFNWLVLDFYFGGNQDRKPGELQAAGGDRQVPLAGLGYLQSKSIIHYDIKLENVLLAFNCDDGGNDDDNGDGGMNDVLMKMMMLTMIILGKMMNAKTMGLL